MEIKRTEVSADSERLILTGYIVSDYFLNQINLIHDDKYFETGFVRIVAKWCILYFKKYKKAPGSHIQGIFVEQKENKRISEDVLELIEDFLTDLSSDFEQSTNINAAYILDVAEKYFSMRKLELLTQNISGLLVSDQIDKAEQAVASHVRVQRPQSGSVDVIRDKKAAMHALNEERDILLELPGGLGELIGVIERGDFLSFMGPMKRGKTFWLEDIAVRLMFRQLKVLFISMEMPKNQMLRRIYQNFLGEPRIEKDITVPYYDEDDIIQYKMVHKKGLTSKAVMRKLKSMELAIKNGSFRLICYPAYSANVSVIKTEIENLRHYEGFHPDAVVIDYADILAPEPGSPKEYRHRINETWLAIRNLAQEIHGLTVTASQSGRGTFSNDIKEEDTAEDVRKLAHVTHMIALNQTKEEKKSQIMRLNVLVSRNEEFFDGHELEVLYNYGIGKAYLDSRMKEKKSHKKEKN